MGDRQNDNCIYWYKGIINYKEKQNIGKPDTGGFYFEYLGQYYKVDLSQSTYEGDFSQYAGRYVNICGKLKAIEDGFGSLIVYDIRIMELPKKILYHDWNNNTYIIQENSLRYDPVKPSESSSGVYDGGSAFHRKITKREFSEIYIRMDKLLQDQQLRIDLHEKPSAFFKVYFKDKEERVIIKYSEDLLEFHGFINDMM